jgi:hypothetical protein
MPGRDAAERAVLSQIGGYNKAIAVDPNPELIARERAARARLAVLQAHRRLTEAAQAYATAEQRLADIGPVES